jgi:hypothetical protein
VEGFQVIDGLWTIGPAGIYEGDERTMFDCVLDDACQGSVGAPW